MKNTKLLCCGVLMANASFLEKRIVMVDSSAPSEGSADKVAAPAEGVIVPERVTNANLDQQGREAKIDGKAAVYASEVRADRAIATHRSDVRLDGSVTDKAPTVGQTEPINSQELTKMSKGFPEELKADPDVVAKLKAKFLEDNKDKRDPKKGIMAHRDSVFDVYSDGYGYVLIYDVNSKPPERLFKSKEKMVDVIKSVLDQTLENPVELKSGNSMYKEVKDSASPLPTDHGASWLSDEVGGFKYLLIKDETKAPGKQYRVWKGKEKKN